MNEVEDDDWVREFDVSHPQKTQAGYTVYRVSSKVYPKGFPEGASEVIVFKRYSEIRALYKELKLIYESRNVEKKKFPRFAKGHFFDRFDESVIEERQRQALSLLSFAGNISFLFTSQSFVKFFEGGVVHTSRSSSYNSCESEQLNTNTDEDLIVDISNQTEPWTPEIYFSEKQDESSDDETIYEISRDLSKTDLSLNSKTNKTTIDEGNAINKKQWLARAMSLCSEGDDIEMLASEAGNVDNSDLSKGKDKNLIPADDGCKGNSVVKTEGSEGSVDMLPTLLESSEDEEQDVFVQVTSPRNSQNSEDTAISGPGGEIDSLSSQMSDSKLKNHLKSSGNDNMLADDIPSDDNILVNCTIKDERKDEKSQVNSILDLDMKSDHKQANNIKETGSSESRKVHKQVGRKVSNIAMSWIDPKNKDYLFNAAQIIQQALYCEANEMYEEAFNKYKMCVGILLNGVQHDSNEKRREAVRRKTAQYLVKAEFLFNTYLKHDDKDISDWSVKPRSFSESINDANIADRQFCHLTFDGLKVIGVIGKKNMLVQCDGLEGVYVVKALHKTNAVHRSGKQENKQTSKSFSKKYVTSTRMVKLHRHFDTNDSIFLLLEYAPGGVLWSHVKSLRDRLFKRQHTSDWFDDRLNSHSRARDCSSGNGQFTSGKGESVTAGLEPTSGGHEISDKGEPISGPLKDVPDNEEHRLGCSEGGKLPGGTLSKERNLDALKGPSNSETNIANLSNEPCSRTDEVLSFDKTTSVTESEPGRTRHGANVNTPEPNEQETCLTGNKTGSHEDKVKTSLQHNNRTGLTCPTGSGDVLGFLDYVSKDCTSIDKCVQYWIAELLLAINSLHSCGIILKDLKPTNVLLDEYGRVKLSYFGVWEEVDHLVDPQAVDKLYCAPEIFRGEKVTFAADWWSLGVLSYELITGKTLSSTHPWGIYPHSSLVFPSEDISTEARSFLSALICHNSRERLGSGMDGVEGIKSHAFFQGVDWNEIAK